MLVNDLNRLLLLLIWLTSYCILAHFFCFNIMCLNHIVVFINLPRHTLRL